MVRPPPSVVPRLLEQLKMDQVVTLIKAVVAGVEVGVEVEAMVAAVVASTIAMIEDSSRGSVALLGDLPRGNAAMREVLHAMRQLAPLVPAEVSHHGSKTREGEEGTAGLGVLLLGNRGPTSLEVLLMLLLTHGTPHHKLHHQ